MDPLTQSKNATILPVLALTLACFALPPQARAVCQEGCLTLQSTVLGEDALLNSTGTNKTALGFDALVVGATMVLAQPSAGLSFEFRETGSLGAARHDNTATLLPSGQVLAAGGENGNGFLRSGTV